MPKDVGAANSAAKADEKKADNDKKRKAPDEPEEDEETKKEKSEASEAVRDDQLDRELYGEV